MRRLRNIRFLSSLTKRNEVQLGADFMLKEASPCRPPLYYHVGRWKAIKLANPENRVQNNQTSPCLKEKAAERVA